MGNTIAAQQTVAAPATPAAPDATRTRVKELAQQFESMLMSQMLHQMTQSMAPEDEDDHEGGLGAGAFADSINSQLGLALSRSGGVGLADVLQRALDRQIPGAAATAGTSSQAAAALAMPSAAPDLLGTTSATGVTDPASRLPLVLPAGRTTSEFGWRKDPISQQVAFHSGTDIKMAYGQEVKAAAGGQVSYVGERTGYGLTVEVDHGGGVVTRYAHLSAAAVAAGQAVEGGQVIANSGNSGRTTGPHLHFEVLENGQAVDPASSGAVFAALSDRAFKVS